MGFETTRPPADFLAPSALQTIFGTQKWCCDKKLEKNLGWVNDNFDLIMSVLDFKGAGNKKTMHDGYFQRRYYKFEKDYSLQIRYFFIAEMRKASSEIWTKQGTYYTAKAFCCSR